MLYLVVVQMRGSYLTVGHRMARGWWYTKAYLASAPLSAIHVFVCTMRPLCLWTPCVSLRPTHPFAFVFITRYFCRF